MIQNYLANRKQRVVLNSKSSKWAPVCAGVPQGSVLSPLFFLVFIHDLVENVNCDVKIFADDASLFSVVEDERRSADELKADLDRVQLWAWQCKMQFNANNTQINQSIKSFINVSKIFSLQANWGHNGKVDKV